MSCSTCSPAPPLTLRPPSTEARTCEPCPALSPPLLTHAASPTSLGSSLIRPGPGDKIVRVSPGGASVERRPRAARGPPVARALRSLSARLARVSLPAHASRPLPASCDSAGNWVIDMSLSIECNREGEAVTDAVALCVCGNKVRRSRALYNSEGGSRERVGKREGWGRKGDWWWVYAYSVSAAGSHSSNMSVPSVCVAVCACVCACVCEGIVPVCVRVRGNVSACNVQPAGGLVGFKEVLAGDDG